MSKANQAFKNADEAVSPVIGVILMVAITVVLAAVVFVLVTRLADNQKEDTPELTFLFDSHQVDGEGGYLTVQGWTGPANTAWESFTRVYTLDNGNIDANPGTANTCVLPASSTIVAPGQRIDCTDSAFGDTFLVEYNPTNTVAYRKVF